MRALLLVDLQHDFMPGGPLGVPGGDRVVPIANLLQPRFELVVATQDWHPADHGSFAASHPGKQPGELFDLDGLQQILWPVHCVQDTRGAALVDGLDAGHIARVFRKGTDRNIDSYSGFFDNGHRKSTGLGDYLRQRGVTELAVLGLATDYCVKFTALDARAEGFATQLVEDASRGVELAPGDVAAAIEQLRDAGVQIVTSDQIPER